MTNATPLNLSDEFAAGLLPSRSIRHAEARAFVEADEALDALPRLLRAVIETAPAKAQEIADDEKLSALGREDATRAAGTAAARRIVEIIQPRANRVAGEIDRALARQPASGEPITRGEFMQRTGAARDGGRFAASDELALIERIRDRVLEADATTLAGAMRDAATSGDVRTFYAVDSLPPALHRKALGNAMLTPEAWAQLRGVLRAALNPENAALAATLRAVGRWVHANAVNARGAFERTRLTLTPEASAAIDAALEDLIEQLARVGN